MKKKSLYNLQSQLGWHSMFYQSFAAYPCVKKNNKNINRQMGTIPKCTEETNL